MSDDHVIPLDPDDPADARMIMQQLRARVAELEGKIERLTDAGNELKEAAEARIAELEAELERLRKDRADFANRIGVLRGQIRRMEMEARDDR